MTQLTGVHHLAVMAGDIKKHIAFFSEVMGCPLVALYDMHGVPGAKHAFLRLNDHCYFSIVQMAGVDDIAIELGKTHAGRGEMPSAPGTLQHLAFNVDSEAEMIAMRDRIRSHGIAVVGPIDHGMCKSMYFGGPDQMTLEVATSTEAVNADLWIDPKVMAEVGISADEVQRYKTPAAYDGPSPVAQPAYDASKPRQSYPEEIFRKMIAVPDDVIFARASITKPPVEAA